MKAFLKPYVKEYKEIEGTEYLALTNEITKDNPYLHPTMPVRDILGNVKYQAFPNRQQRRAKERKFNNRSSIANQNVQAIVMEDRTKYIVHSN